MGEVFFSTIGNELSAHYAIVGDPVWQVKELQNIIKAGEVLVTPKVWFYAQESNYVSHFNKDSKSVKVTGFKDDSEGVHHQHAAVFNFIEMRKQMVENEKESTSVTIPDTLTPSTEALAFGNNLDQSPNYSRKKTLQTRILISIESSLSPTRCVARCEVQKVSASIYNHSSAECNRTYRTH